MNNRIQQIGNPFNWQKYDYYYDQLSQGDPLGWVENGSDYAAEAFFLASLKQPITEDLLWELFPGDKAVMTTVMELLFPYRQSVL